MLRKSFLFFSFYMIAFVLVGCEAKLPNESNQYIIFNMELSDYNVSIFLEYLDDIYISTYDDDKCYNVTPSNILNKYNFQIFKFEKSCATYLFFNNKIFQLGEYFGGYGATHFALENIDSITKLYFIYSWGSGIHRSQIGIFSFDNEELKLIENSYNFDLQFDVSDQNLLEIYKSTYKIKSFVEIKMIKEKFVYAI